MPDKTGIRSKMKTMEEVKKAVEDGVDKQRRNNEKSADKQRENSGGEELVINPAGACGLVDTLLHAMVAQEVQDEDYTVLSEICGTVITKARTGDIGACRLLFDRISGAPVTFMCAMGQEEEVPTEIGIS
jgi:hypothetical protein